MIRCYQGTYIKFEDENKKRQENLVVFEILNKNNKDIKLIVVKSSQLLIACSIEEIVEIAGYHHFKPTNKELVNFGIGNLKPIKTNAKEGMLEGISKATHMHYKDLATSFGRGLLQINDDYIGILDQ